MQGLQETMQQQVAATQALVEQAATMIQQQTGSTFEQAREQAIEQMAIEMHQQTGVTIELARERVHVAQNPSVDGFVILDGMDRAKFICPRAS